MPVNLHGKDYYTVVERMDLLLKEQGRENYSIQTEVKLEGGIIIIKATLILFSLGKVEDEIVPITREYNGHAQCELGEKKILEATETHAIGRALSSAGWFGTEFCSANEMEEWQNSKPSNSTDRARSNSSNNSKNWNDSGRSISNPDAPATEPQLNKIKALCAEKSIDNSTWDFSNFTKGSASEKISELISK